MKDYEHVLQKQFNYVKKLFEERKRFPKETLTDELIFEGNSAYNLFKHAIIAIHHFSSYDFDPPEEQERKDIFNDNSDSIYDEILTKYEITIKEFSRAVNSIPDSTFEEIRPNLANLIMHSVGHIGQAIRLQNMNIKNKMNNRNNS